MSADSKPAMELTRNPVDGSWGFICREHGIHRAGLTERHATNVEAKHLREDHAEPETPTLDLAALAAFCWANAGRVPEVMEAWRLLTGLDAEASVEFGVMVLDAGRPVTAAVVPF